MATPRKKGTGKRGRKPRDWEGLFQEWAHSKLSRTDFLEGKGLNIKTGSVHSATKDWERRLAQLAVGARETFAAQTGAMPEEEQTVAAQAPVAVTPEVTQAVGRDALDARPEASPSSWQVVQQWRRKQVMEDYKSAESVRMHVKLILKHSLAQQAGEGGKVEFRTLLKPHEVRQLTQALGDCQRIQRLALGLSTENVGVDLPSSAGEDQHVEKNVTPSEEPIPTFVVEMSRGGKFMRPRPRRVK